MENTLPKRRKLPHDRPPWAGDEAIYFITLCCDPRGRNQLCEAPVAWRLFETIEFRHARGEMYVHLCVLMPDHLHGLMSFPSHVSMRKLIADWKESASRRAHVVWQRDFFDHRLRHADSYTEKA
ncbi:MAG: transposase, partial [bacterium]